MTLPAPGARYRIPSGRTHIILSVSRTLVTLRWEDTSTEVKITLKTWRDLKGEEVE